MSATACSHLRLGDGGTLEFSDAVRHLHANHLGELVRFDVRSEPLRATGDLEHAADIFLDAVRIEKQGRRRDLAHVDYLVPGFRLVLHAGLAAFEKLRLSLSIVQ